MAKTMRKNTNAQYRGGATRSSEEGTVMVLERRGCVTERRQTGQQTVGLGGANEPKQSL
jgi:hypothetical protein